MRKLIFVLVLLAFACGEDYEPKVSNRAPLTQSEDDIDGLRPCPGHRKWKIIVPPSTGFDPLNDDWLVEIRPVDDLWPVDSFGNTATVITFQVKNQGLSTFKFNIVTSGPYTTVLPGQTKTFTKSISLADCGQYPIARFFPMNIRLTACDPRLDKPTNWKYEIKALSATNYHLIDAGSSVWGANHIYEIGQCPL